MMNTMVAFLDSSILVNQIHWPPFHVLYDFRVDNLKPRWVWSPLEWWIFNDIRKMQLTWPVRRKPASRHDLNFLNWQMHMNAPPHLCRSQDTFILNLSHKFGQSANCRPGTRAPSAFNQVYLDHRVATLISRTPIFINYGGSKFRGWGCGSVCSESSAKGQEEKETSPNS